MSDISAKAPLRIVVLDGHTLNPGDLSWREFEALGSLVVYPRTAALEVAERCAGVDLVLTNKVELSAETIAKLTHLRYVGVLATGFNVVSVAAARARGVTVTNVPNYGTQSVAQHAFALILELTQRTGHHARSVQEGRWSKNPDWCYWDGTLVELADLTLGIVGSGRIGRAVGRIGEAFGMRVQYASRTGGIGELAWLMREADVVSLHCPLTRETRLMINKITLGFMKPTAYLINTGRGALIDETALAEALNSGKLAGAGLDVLSTEPPSKGNPLLAASNCVITPHLAWGTKAARMRLMQIAAANLRAFLTSVPQNVVN